MTDISMPQVIDKGDYFDIVNPEYDILAKDSFDFSTDRQSWVKVRNDHGDSAFQGGQTMSNVNFNITNTNDYVNLSDAYIKVKFRIQERGQSGPLVYPTTDVGDPAVTQPDYLATLQNGGWSLFRTATLEINSRQVQNLSYIDSVAQIIQLGQYSCESSKSLAQKEWFFVHDKRDASITPDNYNCLTPGDAAYNKSLHERMMLSNSGAGPLGEVLPIRQSKHATITLPLRYILSSLDTLPLIKRNAITLSLGINGSYKDIIEVVKRVANVEIPDLVVHITECSLYHQIMVPSSIIRSKLNEQYLSNAQSIRSYLHYLPILSKQHMGDTRDLTVVLPNFSHKPIGMYIFARLRSRTNDLHSINTVYDGESIERLQVSVGNLNFPAEPMIHDPSSNDIHDGYQALLTHFKEDQSRTDHLSLITYDAFLSGKYSLFYIDLSKAVFDMGEVLNLSATINMHITDGDDPARRYDVFAMISTLHQYTIGMSNDSINILPK